MIPTLSGECLYRTARCGECWLDPSKSYDRRPQCFQRLLNESGQLLKACSLLGDIGIARL